MRVLISGDRNWGKPAVIELILDGLALACQDENEPLVIIEGCARGADKVAHDWGNAMRGSGVADIEHYPADWDKYGRGAGPVRNRQMLNEGKPDVVFAFNDHITESKGTRDMCEIASDAGVPVYLVSRYGA